MKHKFNFSNRVSIGSIAVVDTPVSKRSQVSNKCRMTLGRLSALLFALLLCVGQMWGESVTFSGTEKFYFNGWQRENGNCWDFPSSNACLKMRFCNGNYEGDIIQGTKISNDENGIYEVTAPAGTWDKVQVIRYSQDCNNWWTGGKKEDLVSGKNYLHGKLDKAAQMEVYGATPVPIWKIKGSFDNWAYHDFSGTGTTVSWTYTGLAANTTYKFVVTNPSGTDYKNKSFTSASNSQTLQNSGSDASITTTSAGDYVFTLNYSDANSPIVTVTYPGPEPLSSNDYYLRGDLWQKSSGDGWTDNTSKTPKFTKNAAKTEATVWYVMPSGLKKGRFEFYDGSTVQSSSNFWGSSTGLSNQTTDGNKITFDCPSSPKLLSFNYTKANKLVVTATDPQLKSGFKAKYRKSGSGTDSWTEVNLDANGEATLSNLENGGKYYLIITDGGAIHGINWYGGLYFDMTNSNVAFDNKTAYYSSVSTGNNYPISSIAEPNGVFNITGGNTDVKVKFDGGKITINKYVPPTPTENEYLVYGAGGTNWVTNWSKDDANKMTVVDGVASKTFTNVSGSGLNFKVWNKTTSTDIDWSKFKQDKSSGVTCTNCDKNNICFNLSSTSTVTVYTDGTDVWIEVVGADVPKLTGVYEIKGDMWLSSGDQWADYGSSVLQMALNSAQTEASGSYVVPKGFFHRISFKKGSSEVSSNLGSLMSNDNDAPFTQQDDSKKVGFTKDDNKARKFTFTYKSSDETLHVYAEQPNQKSGWTLAYRKTGVSTWTEVAMNDQGEKTLEGLESSQKYYIKITDGQPGNHGIHWFGGLYIDMTNSQKVDFNTKNKYYKNGDIQWPIISQNDPTGVFYPKESKIMVTFDGGVITFKEVVSKKTITFNSNYGSAVAAIQVNQGSAATQPANPTKNNNTFQGWYKNPELTQEYNWSDAVNEDLTLYAKWDYDGTIYYINGSNLGIDGWNSGDWDPNMPKCPLMTDKGDHIEHTVPVAFKKGDDIRFKLVPCNKKYTEDKSCWDNALNWNPNFSSERSTQTLATYEADGTNYKIKLTGDGTYTVTMCYDGVKVYAVITQPDTKTVTFKDGNLTVKTVSVASGGTISAPTIEHRGANIGKWYTDQACTQEFNFSTAITENKTLYAGNISLLNQNYYIVGNIWQNWERQNKTPQMTKNGNVASYTYIAPVGFNEIQLTTNNREEGNYIDTRFFNASASTSGVEIAGENKNLQFTISDQPKEVTVTFDGHITVTMQNYTPRFVSDLYVTANNNWAKVWQSNGSKADISVDGDWNKKRAEAKLRQDGTTGYIILRDVQTGWHQWKLLGTDNDDGRSGVELFNAMYVNTDGSPSYIEWGNQTSSLKRNLPSDGEGWRNISFNIKDATRQLKVIFDGGWIRVVDLPQYTVTFKDASGTQLKQQTLYEEERATAPTGEGYYGWRANSPTEGDIITDVNSIPVKADVTYYLVKAVSSIAIHMEENEHRNLNIGETNQLYVTYTPDDATIGHEITSWESNNGNIISVSNTGLATAKTSGTAKITATTTNDVKAEYNITVNQPSCDGWYVHMWLGSRYTDYCMTLYDAGTTEYRTDNTVVLPSASSDEQITICNTNGTPYHQKTWNINWVPMVGQQASGCNHDGNQYYAGQDAVGYFRIFENNEGDNYFLAFQPTYVAMFGLDDGSNFTQVEFSPIATAHTYQSELCKMPDGYKSDGNYKYYVGTKRAEGSTQTPFIYDGKSKTDALNGVTGLKDDDWGGKYGKFEMYDDNCKANFGCIFLPFYTYELRNDDESRFYLAPGCPKSEGKQTTTFYSGVPEKTGYTCIGWNRAKNQTTTNMNPGASYEYWSGNDVFYPVWQAKTYSVTLNKGTEGTTDGSATATYDSNTLTNIAPATAPAGYTLNGYYTTATDGTKVLNANGTYAAASVSDYITNGKWTKDGNCKLYAQWTILPAITSVTLSETALSMTKDDEVTLTATVQPDGTQATLTWKSSNEAVATVDGNGLVTAVGDGNATITCTATNARGSKSATCSVTVQLCQMELQSIYTNTITGIETYTVAGSVGGSGSVANLFDPTSQTEPATLPKVRIQIPKGDKEYLYYDATKDHIVIGYNSNDDEYCWIQISAGQTSGGQDKFYLRNVKTGKYLCKEEADQATGNWGWSFVNTEDLTASNDTRCQWYFTSSKGNPRLVNYSTAQDGGTGTYHKGERFIHKYSDYSQGDYVSCGSSDGDQGGEYLKTRLNDAGTAPNPNYKQSPVNDSYYRFASSATMTSIVTGGLKKSDKIIVYCYNPGTSDDVTGTLTIGTINETITISAGKTKTYEYTLSADANNDIVVASDNVDFCVSYVEVQRLAPTKTITPEMSWTSTPANPVILEVGKGTATYTATAEGSGIITYASSNTAVATVNATSGQVTPVAKGNAVITATVAAEGCYGTNSISYNVQVNDLDKPVITFTTLPSDAPQGSVQEVVVTTTGGANFNLTMAEQTGCELIITTKTSTSITATVKVGANATNIQLTASTDRVEGSWAANSVDATLTVSACEAYEDKFSFTMQNETDASDVTATGGTVSYSKLNATWEKIKVQFYNNANEPPQDKRQLNGEKPYMAEANGLVVGTLEGDEWYKIPTGNNYNGNALFYLQNVQSGNYICRAASSSHASGGWGNYNTEVASILPTGDDAKRFTWFFESANGKTYLGCYEGADNFSQTYYIHTDNWLRPNDNDYSDRQPPMLVCGRTGNETSRGWLAVQNTTSTTVADPTNILTVNMDQELKAGDKITIVARNSSSTALTASKLNIYLANGTTLVTSIDANIAASASATYEYTLIGTEALVGVQSFAIRHTAKDIHYTSVAVTHPEKGEMVTPTLTWDAPLTKPVMVANGGTVKHVATSNVTTINTITYTSSNTDVATVAEDGTVTMKETPASAPTTITATLQGVGCYRDATPITYVVVPSTNIFTAQEGNNWSNTKNWSLGILPDAETDVTIQAKAIVNINTAAAKTVVIDDKGQDSEIEILSTGGLQVEGTITRTTDGKTNGPTTIHDLYIHSDDTGTGALVFDNSEGNAQAYVEMYSKANIVDKTKNWQYMGTPFSDVTNVANNYYGSYLYFWNTAEQKWKTVKNGTSMSAFAGYCISQENKTTYVMSGTLVSTANKEIILGEGNNVIGNSWTAPINVNQFTDDDFKGDITKTIYMFNTGVDANKTYNEGDAPGTYIAIPINMAGYVNELKVIPAMAGYFVVSNKETGTLTLNYDRLTRTTPLSNEPMRAPNRANREVKPDIMSIKVTGESFSDKLYLAEREDFAEEFDNGWDAEKWPNDAYAPELYASTTAGDQAVSALPELEGTLLGFRAGGENAYTISFQYDGDKTYYLNDLMEQKSTLIRNDQTYFFLVGGNDIVHRFQISTTPFESYIGTGSDNIGDGVQKAVKFIENDKLFILRNGRLYDGTGKALKLGK
ncbi:MAG: Ig-like domain-containing protein [Paludibacteraceae bacterium]|nr:Ig-like domain-containing protein [Paludibacteraceae bacterium]